MDAARGLGIRIVRGEGEGVLRNSPDCVSGMRLGMELRGPVLHCLVLPFVSGVGVLLP